MSQERSADSAPWQERPIKELVIQNLVVLAAVITGPSAILIEIWPQLAFPNAGGVILILAIYGLAAAPSKLRKHGLKWVPVVALLANAAYFAAYIHVVYQQYR